MRRRICRSPSEDGMLIKSWVIDARQISQPRPPEVFEEYGTVQRIVKADVYGNNAYSATFWHIANEELLQGPAFHERSQVTRRSCAAQECSLVKVRNVSPSDITILSVSRQASSIPDQTGLICFTYYMLCLLEVKVNLGLM